MIYEHIGLEHFRSVFEDLSTNAENVFMSNAMNDSTLLKLVMVSIHSVHHSLSAQNVTKNSDITSVSAQTLTPLSVIFEIFGRAIEVSMLTTESPLGAPTLR